MKKKENISISKEETAKELKRKFSFYWFHFLAVELEYFRLWNNRFKDPEIVLIILQVVNLFSLKAKERNLSYKNLYDNPSLLKEFISASISATSISEVTKIPRATCIRKLEVLVKSKLISQDKISKRYYIIPNTIRDDLILMKTTEKVTKVFSEFYFICLRALNVKI